jgi:hypothetical protein
MSIIAGIVGGVCGWLFLNAWPRPNRVARVGLLFFGVLLLFRLMAPA